MTADPSTRAYAGPPPVILLDVNETLSDLSALAPQFEAVGLAAGDLEPWFAGVLRDGFALTTVGVNPSFRTLAEESLRIRLAGHGLPAGPGPVGEVMEGFQQLPVHSDVVAGLRALRAGGSRLVTLSNGAASVAEALLARAGVADAVDLLLSVEDAPAWKPHATAYRHALARCDVEPAEAMLVAVHPWDIDGAARAGLRTGWVHRGRLPAGYPAYCTRPEVSAPDLVALAAAVAGPQA